MRKARLMRKKEDLFAEHTGSVVESGRQQWFCSDCLSCAQLWRLWLHFVHHAHEVACSHIVPGSTAVPSRKAGVSTDATKRKPQPVHR